jgi:DNA polymerase III subunit chi
LRVDFYHLTRAPAEHVLPAIAEKLMGAGARLLIVTPDEDQMDRIDRALWAFKADSFLPHGKAGGGPGSDAAQPILLSPTVTAANTARNIALTDGVWRDEALDFDRAFFLFNPDGIEDARHAWRALGDKNGVERHYWKQDDHGRWVEGP